MAESPASLRRKIASADDLQGVVRAMKAQAAASVGQYEKSVAPGDYARTVDLGLCACLAQGEGERKWQGEGGAGPRLAWPEAAPPSPPRSRRVTRAVVFGSDQGLVGRFNAVVADHARQALAQFGGVAEIWAVGARVQAALAGGAPPLAGVFAVPTSVQAITALVGQIPVKVAVPASHDPPAARASELQLFYNRSKGDSSYAPVSLRLPPLDAAWQRQRAAQAWPSRVRPEVPGPPAATLRALLREYLFVSIFRACAESLASENASRLAAMERADRNIDKMHVTLKDRFHRLRQSRSDEELSDVISGFKALRPAAA